MEQVVYMADGPAADAAWVGVLYESSEWSDFKLAQELAARGLPVRMIDMERPDAVEAAFSCRLLVSRVFASALERGHAACRLLYSVHSLRRRHAEKFKESRDVLHIVNDSSQTARFISSNKHDHT